jgi:hypothetical protein
MMHITSHRHSAASMYKEIAVEGVGGPLHYKQRFTTLQSGAEA